MVIHLFQKNDRKPVLYPEPSMLQCYILKHVYVVSITVCYAEINMIKISTSSVQKLESL